MVAVATEFPGGALGYQITANESRIPYWGKGSGALVVDYGPTSQRFWALVLEHKPVAIMSFSRNDNDTRWVLELGATNLAQSQWRTVSSYFDNNNQPQQQTLDMPFVGGTQQDLSPYKGTSILPNGPPDPTQNVNAIRTTSLPRQAIATALSKVFSPSQLLPVIENDVLKVGNFVSAYMAYHVSWYASASVSLTQVPCRAAGHTHVGILITVKNAQRALDIQLDALIKYLNDNP